MRHLATLTFLATLGILALGATAAQAIGSSGPGVRVGVVSPEDLDTTLSLGVHWEFTDPASRFHFSPELRYWSDDPVSDVAIDLNGYYHFLPPGQSTPYVGGGVGVNFLSYDLPGGGDETDTEAGFNILGGMRFPVGEQIHGFVEGRYVISEIDQLMILGGVTIHLR